MLKEVFHKGTEHPGQRAQRGQQEKSWERCAASDSAKPRTTFTAEGSVVAGGQQRAEEGLKGWRVTVDDSITMLG